MHERIRNRRAELGMAANELAKRARISPSYVSLIESGDKVPREDVAVRIAAALRDDSDLYRAWARSARHHGDLEGALRDVQLMARYSGSRSLRRRLALGEDLETEAPRELAASYRVRLREDDAPRLLRIPLLAEGADPGPTPDTSPHVVSWLTFDPAMLPDIEASGLFAYRVGRRDARRLAGILAPDDLVILSVGDRLLAAGKIHAVRHDGSVILSRVLFKGRSLLLLPAEGEADFEVIELGDERDPTSAIAGTVVLKIAAG
jgi:transcriptional regulator with XRE-family HTH domain